MFTTTFYKWNYILGLNPYFFFAGKMYWQIFSYMFVHASMSHILFNMLALVFFGLAVERTLGSKEFLLFYHLSGTIVGILTLLVHTFTGNNALLMGASGSGYAVLLMYAVIFPKSQIYVWGILPVPAPVLVLIYALIEFLSQLSGTRGNVAHFAHLAGFAVAWLYIAVRMGVNPVRVWKNAWR